MKWFSLHLPALRVAQGDERQSTQADFGHLL
jgi:hypothetical protein